MKKLICVFLLAAMALTLVACGGGSGDSGTTVYIVKSVTCTNPDGTQSYTATTTFEEGWKNKETFTATITTVTGSVEQSLTVTYSDKTIASDIQGSSRSTSKFNEKGQRISAMVEMLDESVNISRTEFLYTYDELGLPKTETVTTSYKDGTEAETTTATYSCMDMDDTYVLTGENGNYVMELTYDKKTLRKIREEQYLNNVGISRVEITYDDTNCTIKEETYARGNIQTVVVYQYEKVKVSEKTAAIIPQFAKMVQQ